MQDDDRATGRVEASEDAVDEVALGTTPDASGISGCVVVHELDLDGPASAPPCEVDAGVDDQPMDPRLEAVGVLEGRQVAPRADESVLDPVACELGSRRIRRAARSSRTTVRRASSAKAS